MILGERMKDIVQDIIENMTKKQLEELVNKLKEKANKDEILQEYNILVKLEKEI